MCWEVGNGRTVCDAVKVLNSAAASVSFIIFSTRIRCVLLKSRILNATAFLLIIEICRKIADKMLDDGVDFVAVHDDAFQQICLNLH